ncbi:uncharacterized protein GGS22DRAFT_197761 [Annulohypoxylon maeteangense]|uniref:uncharacterized protein n=1 Tax=Annulohypoxylon maeteangense TaxID=1927788 RepID=UPI00200789F3|nr:uncharacterized protein GGS22DRAFT_197761 [Annulohypoxylon maeteangense]KAI0887846.1 hypothetical protein GGS22DRAFT_197761 [Annulohypoxylon maeteangense]
MPTTMRGFSLFWDQQATPWRCEDEVESSEALLEEDVERYMPASRGRGGNRIWWVLSLINAIFFGGAVFLYSAAWVKHTGRNACLKATSIYSPVLEEVNMPLTNTLLNGSLWLGENPPIWRAVPDSNKVEEIWEDFEHVKPIALTRNQILAMGKDPATVVKFDDEYWGLGDDAYVGGLDFFHQVHCLNTLRHEAFRYWNREGETVPKWNDIHWVHIQHCVGMMMEHTLCNADAGFMTYNWMEHEKYPFPDMSVRKQCRDWRQLIEYRDTHSVNKTLYSNWKKPEGVTQLKQPQDWWEHRGEYDRAHYANGTVITG